MISSRVAHLVGMQLPEVWQRPPRSVADVVLAHGYVPREHRVWMGFAVLLQCLPNVKQGVSYARVACDLQAVCKSPLRSINRLHMLAADAGRRRE